MYREYVRSHGLEDAVTIGQFMQAEGLAEMYTIADALLLLSDYEPWGMVVNEAMCFGLPVAVSEHVGASMDLVRRDSGIIISDGEIGAPDLLARRLLDIRRLTAGGKNAGRVIKARVGAWNNELAAERIRDVLGSL